MLVYIYNVYVIEILTKNNMKIEINYNFKLNILKINEKLSKIEIKYSIYIYMYTNNRKLK